ncbi:MAG TPA: hypothetical protein VNT30_08660 [Stellaceae bacterium]|nr:hypothetical protein [Stellaceae bacterium]
MPTEIATQVNTLAASGDVAGIAALAAANPSLAIDIATLAATDRADLAALIAGAIAAADPADAAAIALAVLAALPADQRDAAGPIIAAAVIQAVPGSEATLTAAGFSPAANLNSTLAAQLTAILATGFTPPSENSRQVGSPA